ncbi:hypothetical protein E3N88_34654 [Mikania micrantha]|uniref:Uncharacterized protein n=1 Tax=Mikania micrantha TaxID=192012 RepID=A0A5N6LYS5_9ASTR|nr:hypothetical protein E3N88_34654 [Mikania micrantha]
MVQWTIHHLCRRVAPGTVEAVIRPVAHALTQSTTGPNHRAVARLVSPRRPDDDPPEPSRRTGPQYGAKTPRAARSGAPHGKRAVDAAAVTPREPVIELAPPESARAPASNHHPQATAAAPAKTVRKTEFVCSRNRETKIRQKSGRHGPARNLSSGIINNINYLMTIKAMSLTLNVQKDSIRYHCEVRK